MAVQGEQRRSNGMFWKGPVLGLKRTVDAFGSGVWEERLIQCMGSIKRKERIVAEWESR